MFSRNQSKVRALLWIIVLLVPAFLAGLAVSRPSLYEIKQPKGPIVSGPDVQELVRVSHAVADLAAVAKKGVVYVSVAKVIKSPQTQPSMPFGFPFDFGPEGGDQGGGGNPPLEEQGVGSGFIIDMDKGYIVTNNHVVEGADDIQVRLANGAIYPAKVVGRDKATDVAVVRIKDAKYNRNGISELYFGDSDQVRVGDRVLCLGAPFTLASSVTSGIISATGRGGLGITEIGNFLQTDAAINPGNSGGPMLDVEGHVIGIDSAIFSRSGAFNGIGFAIPANIAKLIVRELISYGKVHRGYLGAQLMPLTPEVAQDLHLSADTGGAVITNVVPDSPASKAGLKPGDVVVDAGGKAISDADELVRFVGLLSPGSKATLTVVRNGKKTEIPVTIGEWPSGGAVMASGGSAQGYGMGLAPVSPETQQRFGYESDHGAVIVSVAPGSPAARAGLQQGDVIVSANGHRINTPEQVQAIARKSKRLLLRIERQGQYAFISVHR